MKNILYVGPYKQDDGWGEAAKEYLRSFSYACSKLGHKLKAKPIYLSSSIDKNVPTDILEQEKTAIDGDYDIIIQKALPQAICVFPSYKNIALCVFEQRNLGHSSYIKQVFSRMDQVLVPSIIEKHELELAGINQTKNISQPINVNEIFDFVNNREKSDPLKLKTKYQNHIKFYFVGSFIARKNIMNLIVAFNNEFQRNEKALLVIKTDAMSQQQREMVSKNIQEAMSNMKYHRHLKDNIIILSNRLSRSDLLSLHYNCDSFVCASKGEAFCRPLAESIAFGNYPVAVDGTGAAELIDLSVGGQIIPSHLDYVEPNPGNKSLDHDCELEQWCETTVYDIRKSLRKAYDQLSSLNNSEKNNLKDNLKQYSQKFSIESIGERICSLDIM